MTFGSLFTGIGGLDLGLERAGMGCRWQVEIEPYCQQVLAKHWPNVPRYSDVRTINFHEIEPVDLICGGPPCQPASVAGKRKGGTDDRWLWPEFLRAVRELRPRWVLAENPPGLLSVGAGRWFGSVLRELAEGGYDAEWNVLSAASVGAPHLRERVWLVAYPRSQAGRGLCAGRRGTCASEAPAPAADVEGESVRPGLRPIPAAGIGRRRSGDGNCAVLHAHGERCEEQRGAVAGGAGLAELAAWWAVEPDVVRVVHGVPARVDRIRGLGNAVVPQCAECIGRLILAAENAS